MLDTLTMRPSMRESGGEFQRYLNDKQAPFLQSYPMPIACTVSLVLNCTRPYALGAQLSKCVAGYCRSLYDHCAPDLAPMAEAGETTRHNMRQQYLPAVAECADGPTHR